MRNPRLFTNEARAPNWSGELAVYVKTLTRSITTDDMRHVGHLRGRIRHTVNVIRSIERMVAALDDDFFGLGVQGGGRFVEDEDEIVADGGAGDPDPLALSAALSVTAVPGGPRG